ncbi:MAG: hypothetical protein WCF30_05590 [Terracidiphilus sp.]
MYPISRLHHVNRHALTQKRFKSGSIQDADWKNTGWLQRGGVSELAMRRCAAVNA